jgi:hypothetical protein
MTLRRATWRWCLAGGGAAFILLGIALGIPSGGASTENASRRHVGARSPVHHPPNRHGSGHGHRTDSTTTTNAATGLGVPVPVGSSDGTSLDAVQPAPTTLPSRQDLGVGATTPAVQSVPITTTAAVLILVIGFGAFAAGWTIGRRRALPRA